MHQTTKNPKRKPSDPATPTMPLGISRLNCEALAGITERQLYDLGRKHDLPRLPGKIPVYRADALLALFACDLGEVGAENTNDEPTSADGVLAALGRRRLGGVGR